MVGGFIRAIQRSRQLRRTSRVLSEAIHAKSYVASEADGNAKDSALRDLLFLCDANVLRDLHATREECARLYRLLVAHGGDRWVGGQYVAASALASPEVLRESLEAVRRGEDPRQLTSSVVRYFEHGMSGPLTTDGRPRVP